MKSAILKSTRKCHFNSVGFLSFLKYSFLFIYFYFYFFFCFFLLRAFSSIGGIVIHRRINFEILKKRENNWLKRGKEMVISWWSTFIDDYFSSMGSFVSLFGSFFFQFWSFFFFDFTNCNFDDECYYILLWLVVVIALKVVITRLVNVFLGTLKYGIIMYLKTPCKNSFI